MAEIPAFAFVGAYLPRWVPLPIPAAIYGFKLPYLPHSYSSLKRNIGDTFFVETKYKKRIFR